MEDDILKDEDGLDIKLPPEVEKSGDILDDAESIEELAEEEEEDVIDGDKFDDENPI